MSSSFVCARLKTRPVAHAPWFQAKHHGEDRILVGMKYFWQYLVLFLRVRNVSLLKRLCFSFQTFFSYCSRLECLISYLTRRLCFVWSKDILVHDPSQSFSICLYFRFLFPNFDCNKISQHLHSCKWLRFKQWTFRLSNVLICLGHFLKSAFNNKRLA